MCSSSKGLNLSIRSHRIIQPVGYKFPVTGEGRLVILLLERRKYNFHTFVSNLVFCEAQASKMCTKLNNVRFQIGFHDAFVLNVCNFQFLPFFSYYFSSFTISNNIQIDGICSYDFATTISFIMNRLQRIIQNLTSSTSGLTPPPLDYHR